MSDLSLLLLIICDGIPHAAICYVYQILCNSYLPITQSQRARQGSSLIRAQVLASVEPSLQRPRLGRRETHLPPLPSAAETPPGIAAAWRY